MGETFDVSSVTDIMYNEDSSHKDSRFIFADEGKPQLRPGECIRYSDKGRNYTSFWRDKNEE